MTAAEDVSTHVPLENDESPRRGRTAWGAGKEDFDRSFRFSTPPTTGGANTLTRTYGCVSDWPPRTGSCSAKSGHNPARSKLPVLAGRWFARYDAGYHVARRYTAARNQPS